MKAKVKPTLKKALSEIREAISDRRSAVLLVCVAAVVCYPFWIGAFCRALFGLRWHGVMKAVMLTLWSGPLTPLIPCLVIAAFSVKVQADARRGARQGVKDLLPKNCRLKPLPEPSADKITYGKLFWLFIGGSLAGVIVEGVFCLLKKGHWESHVVSVFGYFNILYGCGAVLFHSGAALMKKKNILVKSLVLAFFATVLELLCGLILKYGLGMRAWNYQNRVLNYDSMICVGFSIGWGIAACAYCLLYPYINALFNKIKGRGWTVACRAFTLFMVINLSLTAASIYRWSLRHGDVAARNGIEIQLDAAAPDDWMQDRFIEWKFID